MTSNYEHIVFYDFEASTDVKPHRPYLVSYALDNQCIKSFYGPYCARQFLNRIPDNTLAIAHNGGGYDITFIIDHLTFIYSDPIIKNGRVLQLTGAYRVKTFKDNKWLHEHHRITFKDS